MLRPAVWIGRFSAFGWLVGLVAWTGAAEPLDFNRDIRPILSNACFKCHGFDAPQRQAELRLDTLAGATAELPSGMRAIVPGKSGESELVSRVRSTDASVKMPPPDSGKTLTAEQVELLARWVDEGAPYAEHWSLTKIERPAQPAVQKPEWVANPIDAFILARLEKEGLAPSPAADKVTLLRRVTLDLTGLPPTLAEVDAFLADDSPEAYAKLVDRLLASPRYGEHMARYWLDEARYGDTHGLHLDNERSMWLYRDWVINAFNSNLPFDQFTVEQLAGDLLPNATQEQRIASGFNRCNVSTGEGGSIDDEVLVRYAVDRTEAMSTVWLGMTLGCAVCHDHKFDPVTQKEFYQLYAFFNSAADAAMDGNQLLPPPMIKAPTPEQVEQQRSLDAELAQANEQMQGALAKIEYHEPAGASLVVNQPHEFVWIEDALPAGGKPSATDAGWQFVSQLDRPVYSGERATIRQAKGLSQHYFLEANPGLKIGEGDRLFAYVYLDPSDPPKSIMLQFNDGQWDHRAFWGEDVIPFGESGTPNKLPMGGLPVRGQWVRLEVEAAKVGLKPGSVLNGWAFTQHDGTVLWDRAGIVTRTPQAGQYFDSLAAWEAAERAQGTSTLPKEVREAVMVESGKRTPEQTALVRAHFFEHFHAGTREQLAPLRQKIDDVNKRVAELDAAVPRTMVMANLEKSREAFVLIRGAYDKKSDKVEPGTPAILPPMPADAPRNRLGLARWLVDPAHPLPARVTVNRYWQQYFGVGIVKTAEDFGSQAEWPSHLDLLDWLAAEFIESGWNVKHLQKLIVTSSAYRQSSKTTAELVARDPENRLVARGPRYRVDAEVVRDIALATSGLLVEKVGGKSVKPYQPEGLWETVGFIGSNTRDFKRDSGEALYRRSMYTFWKRTCPPPSLTAFDAPSRETCTVRRARTNTPLQALALMNDVQFVETSRALATRMMKEGGAAPAERAAFGWRLATARVPESDELAVLVGMYEKQLGEFRADAEAAKQLLAVGESKRDEALDPAEHAAWTMVANLILNLDETITKE
ncbi:MAG: PSD1 and planctomycete cytochrome C domain-containing protein [Pirellulales bacterium]|nr:PSD1 and planctomycete cytochrome C domain-containing protein [Pirellulales bacterium]